MIKMSDDNNWFEVAPIRNTSKKTAWYLSTNISSLRFGACAGAMNGWVDGGGAKESREKKARRAKARPVLRAAVAACSVVSALGCQQRLYPRWCVGHRHVIDQLVEPPRADDRRSTRWCHLNPRRRKAKKKEHWVIKPVRVSQIPLPSVGFSVKPSRRSKLVKPRRRVCEPHRLAHGCVALIGCDATVNRSPAVCDTDVQPK